MLRQSRIPITSHLVVILLLAAQITDAQEALESALQLSFEQQLEILAERDGPGEEANLLIGEGMYVDAIEAWSFIVPPGE